MSWQVTKCKQFEGHRNTRWLVNQSMQKHRTLIRLNSLWPFHSAWLGKISVQKSGKFAAFCSKLASVAAEKCRWAPLSYSLRYQILKESYGMTIRFWMVITPISVVGSTFRIIPSVYYKEARCRTTRPNSPRGQPWSGNVFSGPKIWNKSEKFAEKPFSRPVFGFWASVGSQHDCLGTAVCSHGRFGLLGRLTNQLFEIWKVGNFVKNMNLGGLTVRARASKHPRTLLVTKHFISDHS